MPQEATSMPPNGQIPMQPTAPVPQAMPNSYGTDSNTQGQLSAAALANAQANILAKAIIEAQNFAAALPPTQPVAPANPEIQPRASADPTETEETINKVSSGERVIQPLHDPRIQQQREDMAKRMTELLGDAEYEPVQINTNTAKHMRAEATMTVPNATQASEAVPQVMQPQMAQPQMQPQMQTQAPTPFPQVAEQPGYQPTAQMQLAPTPQLQPQQMQSQQIPPQAASGQAIYSQMIQQPQFMNTSQNVMAQMQQPVVQYQQSTQQSMDPRTAAIKLQALQAEEQHKNQISEAEQEALAAQQEALRLQAQANQARALADQKAENEKQIQEEQAAEHAAEEAAKQQQAQAIQAAQQQAQAAQNGVVEDDGQPKTLFSQLRARAQHTNMRVNPDVVQKAAEATILVSEKTPAEEPVQVIQPAYIQELETQLATDMQTKGKDGELGSQMAAELANDQITLEASKIKVEAPKTSEEQEKDAVDATPDAVLAAMQNAMTSPNLESNPNFK
ncbi:MAG: hypothetical protein Q4D22_03960 [Candidatus Saccharibacteria bacterium]|nr:hypothetical protein [Candidatus Saccharibacteria bacterium]